MPVQTQMEAGETTMGTTMEGTTAVSVNHATTLSDAKISASTLYRCASCASLARLAHSFAQLTLSGHGAHLHRSRRSARLMQTVDSIVQQGSTTRALCFWQKCDMCCMASEQAQLCACWLLLLCEAYQVSSAEYLS